MVISNKKGASFIEIIGFIGAVLIFIGVVWLIAYNWHVMPSFLKVLILVLSTLAAFSVGVLLRTYEHEGIGRTLLVLGALLYISSVFLIAQIYSTRVTMQGTAWLFFLCWAGIFLTAYALNSKENIFVGLITFFVWFGVQFFALYEGNDVLLRNGPSFGILAFGFLSLGILLYGLNLIHKSGNHGFSRVYSFWMVFYFLALAYILSFQTVLPVFWQSAFSFSSPLFFVLCISVVSLVTLLFGIILASSKKIVSSREIIVFILVILFFCLFMLSTLALKDTYGNCSPKYCYDFSTTSSCNSAPLSSSYNNRGCVWTNGGCSELNCGNYRTQAECISSPSFLDCQWDKDFCREADCYSLNSQPECSLHSNCLWVQKDGSVPGQCTYSEKQMVQDSSMNRYTECSKNNNEKDACDSNNSCKWNPGFGFRTQDMSPLMWLIWVGANIFFIIFILVVISYGKLNNYNSVMNLGLGFFILEIVTRYAGFVMDFGGYLGLAWIFILGGVMLILLGILLSVGRKKLIKAL